MDNEEFITDLKNEIKKHAKTFLQNVDKSAISTDDYDFIEKSNQIDDLKKSMKIIVEFDPTNEHKTLLHILKNLNPQYKIGGFCYKDNIKHCVKNIFDEKKSLKETINDYDLDFMIRKKLDEIGFKNIDEYMEKNYNTEIKTIMKEKEGLKTNDKFKDHPEVIILYNKLNRKMLKLL